MRYDTPIYFRSVTPGSYDSSTGDYEDPSVTETMVLGSVEDTSIEMMRIVYGQICAGSVTVHLQQHYAEAFSQIRIDETIYKVDLIKKLRTKEALILSELWTKAEVQDGTGNTADRD